MKSSFSCFILLAAAASSSLQTVYAGCWLFPSSCKAPPAPSKPATNPSPTSNNNNVSSASLTNNNNMTAAKSSSSSSSSSSGFKRVHHHNKLVQRPTPNLKNKKTGNTTTSGSNLKMGVSQPGNRVCLFFLTYIRPIVICLT